MSVRRGRRGAALLLAAGLLAGCNGGHGAPGAAGGSSQAAAPPAPLPLTSTLAPSPPPPPEARALPGAGGSGAVPMPASVVAVLRGPLAEPALGPAAAVRVLVADAATGRPLVATAADDPAPPASTTKLLTAVAALDRLGAATQLRTRVFAAAPPDAAGTVTGDLVLVGAGDPTLTAGPPQEAGQAGLADLVVALRAAGVRRVTGRVVGDGSLFTGGASDPGWLPGYVTGGSVAPVTALQVDGGRFAPSARPAPRYADPALAAVQALARQLRAAGVATAGTAVGLVPAGAVELAHVDGLNVQALTERMLAESDNDIAEALGRLVAQDRGLPSDAGAAARAVIDAVGALGVPTSGVALSDTSGLSLRDRIPAATLVALLRLTVTAGHPELRAVALGIPVAGRSGTLAERFRTGAARAGFSRVHAKTGALSGVSTLVGWVVDRGGRLLVFSLGSSATVNRPGAEAALDRAAAALATVQ